MPFDSSDLILARIDERTKIIAEEIASIKVSVEKLNGIVLTGNGKESLVTRVSLLEDDLDRQGVQCEKCRAIILKPHDDTAPIVELAKTNLIEGWKFRTAVAIAAFSTISALIIAIFKP